MNPLVSHREGAHHAACTLLQNPDPADWLNWRRTLDGWGYSPLDQGSRSPMRRAAGSTWRRRSAATGRTRSTCSRCRRIGSELQPAAARAGGRGGPAPHERRGPADQRVGGGSSPRRTTSFARPCRDIPSCRAARLRLPPARTSASSTNLLSKARRASASVGRSSCDALRIAAGSKVRPDLAVRWSGDGEGGQHVLQLPPRCRATRGRPARSSSRGRAGPGRGSASGCGPSSARRASRCRCRGRGEAAPAGARHRGGTGDRAGTALRPDPLPGCGLVAATTRRSSRRVTFSPTFRISPSCSVRSSFACARGDNSPTSSRNTVPPDEASSRPRRDCTAPVKAPLACPKSSVSMRSSLNVAQLTAANISSRRGPSSCRARATSSLPVPLSPSISTGNGAAAALLTSSRSATITALSPIKRATPVSSPAVRRTSRHAVFTATGPDSSKRRAIRPNPGDIGPHTPPEVTGSRFPHYNRVG